MSKRPSDSKVPKKKPSTRSTVDSIAAADDKKDPYRKTSFSKRKIEEMSDSLYAREKRGDLNTPSGKKLLKDYRIKGAQRDSADAVNKLKKLRKSKP